MKARGRKPKYKSRAVPKDCKDNNETVRNKKDRDGWRKEGSSKRDKIRKGSNMKGMEERSNWNSNRKRSKGGGRVRKWRNRDDSTNENRHDEKRNKKN